MSATELRRDGRDSGQTTLTESSDQFNLPLLQDSPERHSSGSLNDSFLVGSPDQLDILHGTTSRVHTTSNTSIVRNSTPRPRPSLGGRGFSTPLISRRHAPSSSHYTSPGLSSIQLDHDQPEHRWTLFGQLMENEGQTPTPTFRKRPSAHRFRSSSGMSTVRRDDSGPLLDVGSVAGNTHLTPLVSSSPPSVSVCTSVAYEEADEEDEDEDEDEEDESLNAVLQSTHPTSPKAPNSPWYSLPQIPVIPVLYRNVFKCSLAYFLASLFTFNPFLSDLMSKITTHHHGRREPFQSGHMVATIVVYFNPAKTIGGMIEADIFCLVGLLYAAFVCLSSMSMFWWLELSPGWEWLGDLVAILWIGVSMSVVSWLKVWMVNPSFNTACSMTAIIISVVIVKEGGLVTLLQVSTTVVCGSLISNFVCYMIWPQSAIYNLQKNMTRTLESFSTVLSMLTSSFLLEGGSHKKANIEKVKLAIEDHQSSFTSLKKSFSEARTEWPLRGNAAGAQPEEIGKRAYEDTIDSLNRLGQHLNGLRSGTRLQAELTRAGIVNSRSRKHKKHSDRPIEVDLEASIDDDDETATLKAAAAMFGDLVDDLGSPLKALSSACIFSLKRLREAFEQSQSHQGKEGVLREDEFIELADAIERALVRFESTSNHAVLRLYRKSDMRSSPRPASLSSYQQDSVFSSKGDNPDNIESDNERVLLVYFFIFTLQEYAREVVSLIDAMSRVQRYEQDRLLQSQWGKRLRRCIGRIFNSHSTIPKRNFSSSVKRTFASYIIRSNRHPKPFFPKVRPHAPNTVQTPPSNRLSLVARIKQLLWKLGHRLIQRDTKYAFKVGMAIAMLAAPAFFEPTRKIFVEYWGDWALISFFAVMSPTIGATNHLGVQRVIGTLFGAVVAASIFSLCSDSAPVLSVFGFVFSLPCFYYAVAHPQYLSASRFVLLTYNLTCLYCYNLRQKDISVVTVAKERAIAVTAGVLWAAFVSRFWWPSEARRELGRALSEFCLNIGWLYTRLVASNSFAPEYHSNDNNMDSEGPPSTPSTLQSTKLNNSIKEFMAMELHLQIKLIELQDLLAQTAHEPRLKGPFPIMLYRGILTSLQTILDKLHSMRCVTTREEWYTSVRQDFIVPVNKERREMVGNIILYFSTLASAFMLKAPLPPYLPPAEKARQRLVNAIRHLEVVKNRNVKGSRQLLYFAYALTMKGVIEELESLGRTLQTAFGVIGDSPEDFDALFMYPEDGRRLINHAV